ncbi:peptide chain release factor N(5)-glutamine methyltransferase [Candidatus Acetothermia bacterium]|nr:peptide chain release factor N(5)-glutamine methyltransferase [Candidatus Acetothermia bacterium]MBI3643868.1 peptide chain release factor N(5)-glutamine methyltransferase [Candidatus Acetothermia bacterium]
MQAVRERLTKEEEQSAPNRSSWTIREALDWTTQYFRQAGIANSRFEAEELLAHALKSSRLTLYVNPTRVLDPEESVHFRELIQKRKAGTPSAYLVGDVDFVNVRLRVNPHVLIPRAETEELVERILNDFNARGHQQHEAVALLDLGTGSGAIAIALLKSWPAAQAVAVDISADALDIAQENALANGVAERITLLLSDWAAAVTGIFDLVVANPPYIPTEELEGLSNEVTDHEPRLALDGGLRGTREIERLLQQVPHILKPGGFLYLEIGYNQGEAVHNLLSKSCSFSEWEVFPDLAGRDRMIRAIRTKEE